MQHKILLVNLILCGACSAAPACTSDGAFGISFGSKPPAGAQLEEEGNVSTWYVVTPPEPDPNFDLFQIRVSNATSEVLEVVATKTITRAPALTEPPLDPERRKQGEERSKAFALQYIAQLPPQMQSRVALEKYSSDRWRASVSEDVVMGIRAGFAWDVTVSCKDTKREWALARKAMPELFQGKSK